MKNLWESLKRDLWVVLLDIVAVNASYILALLIRFYVNSTLRPVAVDRYLPAWESFTPIYTVLCIVVFAVWKLYGGMWRYAGINDMNRIILASVVTAAIHVIGTTVFFTRMPITYYLIGAVIQFVLITTIRFAYRVLLVEKKRLKTRHMSRIPAVVIGSGENGRRVVKHLEEEGAYKPVVILSSDTHATGTMDGIPVQSIEGNDISVLSEKMNDIGAVFIADPLLPSTTREEIRKITERYDADLMDYTGFISNLGGRLSLTELLSTIHGPVSVVIDDEARAFEDSAAALNSLTGKYVIKSIDGTDMKIKVEKANKTNTEEALRVAYAAVTGA